MSNPFCLPALCLRNFSRISALSALSNSNNLRNNSKVAFSNNSPFVCEVSSENVTGVSSSLTASVKSSCSSPSPYFTIFREVFECFENKFHKPLFHSSSMRCRSQLRSCFSKLMSGSKRNSSSSDNGFVSVGNVLFR